MILKAGRERTGSAGIRSAARLQPNRSATARLLLQEDDAEGGAGVVEGEIADRFQFAIRGLDEDFTFIVFLQEGAGFLGERAEAWLMGLPGSFGLRLNLELVENGCFQRAITGANNPGLLHVVFEGFVVRSDRDGATVRAAICDQDSHVHPKTMPSGKKSPRRINPLAHVVIIERNRQHNEVRGDEAALLFDDLYWVFKANLRDHQRPNR
jgi:hypothetical protein